MLTIRGFVLDGVALLGIVAGITAGIGGYLRNLPGPPESVAIAAAGWSDPETTGSITPREEGSSPKKRGRHARFAKPAEANAEPPKGWVDPFYNKRDR